MSHNNKNSWLLPIAITIALGFIIVYIGIGCKSTYTPWQPKKELSHKRYKR